MDFNRADPKLLASGSDDSKGIIHSLSALLFYNSLYIFRFFKIQFNSFIHLFCFDTCLYSWKLVLVAFHVSAKLLYIGLG